MSELELNRRHKALVSVAIKHFSKGGWSMVPTTSDAQDFIATSGNLRYPIRCIAEIWGQFRSVESIIDAIEKEVRFHRSNFNRIQITVLERNFLLIPLDVLLQRGMFVTTLDDLDEVVNIAECGAGVPDDLTDRQWFLVRGDPGYALFVARLLIQQRREAEAADWLDHAVSTSSGFTPAHLELFSLYQNLGRLQDAETMADYLQKARPDDPKVIKLMVAFYKVRGEFARAEFWQAKLISDSAVPRTFADILERQKRNLPLTTADGEAKLNKDAAPIVQMDGGGALARWLRALRLTR